MSDLAARLMDCPLFELAAGMLLTDGAAVAFRVHHDGIGLVLLPNVRGWPAQSLGDIEELRVRGLRPVLTDDGTAGCLLAMLGDRLWSAERYDDGPWGVWVRSQTPGDAYEHMGDSLAEACARALVAIGRCS